MRLVPRQGLQLSQDFHGLAGEWHQMVRPVGFAGLRRRVAN